MTALPAEIIQERITAILARTAKPLLNASISEENRSNDFTAATLSIGMRLEKGRIIPSVGLRIVRFLWGTEMTYALRY